MTRGDARPEPARGVLGVYAAGDVRAGSIKRCATAVGEGAAAVRSVHAYLVPAPGQAIQR